MTRETQKTILTTTVEHIDITSFDATPIIEAYSKMAFQARNLARAARIADRMLADKNCSVVLCLAGSLFSAGLKKVVVQMLRSGMVDVIVSTGAIMVDQDFFEALGFRHFQGNTDANDHLLLKNRIDRIYDTYINEDELRTCDFTIRDIANSLPKQPHSSREFIREMGRYLEERQPKAESVVLEAYRQGIPIIVPAFSDCSAGFGLVLHQWEQQKMGKPALSMDSAKDFLELTKIKLESRDTGLIMIGGGVPKNFAQDVPVAADLITGKPSMHKYAIQITVADERDGALSGSTLQEAHSWGKVTDKEEQMVFSEATLVFPLLASYLYHSGNWKTRKPKRYNDFLAAPKK